jgi:head-tail adaptor
MIIGKLDRKLKLYKSTFINNLYGERIVSSSTFVTIYGSFDFKSGKTTYDADALINEERIECLIRYRTDIGVSPQYSLTFGTTVYSIKSIKEVGRKDKLILTLVETDAQDLTV